VKTVAVICMSWAFFETPVPDFDQFLLISFYDQCRPCHIILDVRDETMIRGMIKEMLKAYLHESA